MRKKLVQYIREKNALQLGSMLNMPTAEAETFLKELGLYGLSAFEHLSGDQQAAIMANYVAVYQPPMIVE